MAGVRQTDGQFSFEQGADSGRIPTIKGNLVPNGLMRSQVAWAGNATMRGGCIAPRAGWKKLCRAAQPGAGIFQGGYCYDASVRDDVSQPYLILSIGGSIMQVRVDTNNSVVSLSAAFGMFNPTTVPQAFFCQGEEFLVIQAGDYLTLPLFWDGATLIRSRGLP